MIEYVNRSSNLGIYLYNPPPLRAVQFLNYLEQTIGNIMSNSSEASNPSISFTDLELSESVQKAIRQVGYETPSPIQAEVIPHMLSGSDVIGQAQTGTGKTAAFALPILSRIKAVRQAPQVLVLTPTRELAIQVAEAFQNYASTSKGFQVLPIYGGQDYRGQLKQLKRQPQVIIGTPGRVMDHMRRKTLDLSKLTHLVLDEADEMLRMGFIDDVEWILEQTPESRQIALFSATMPKQIHKIARTYLTDPKEVKIQVKTTTADTIEQHYWIVRGIHKLDALTRMLEVTEHDGIIIFVRTKSATTELADKLQARGYAAGAINGDMAQNNREATVNKLKKGHIDILIATDVAARGLDVERLSHVINYDIPYDTESYVHRIGRTGRAGRKGQAILFVAPRERRLLHSIEKATNTKISPMQLPSAEVLNSKRIEKFNQKIVDAMSGDLTPYVNIIEQFLHENEVTPIDIAAALAKLAQGKDPLFVKDVKSVPEHEFSEKRERRPRRERNKGDVDVATEMYQISVGHKDGVKPGNIVGAIANEAGLDSQYIGRIKISDEHSTLTLPSDMPKEVFNHLQGVIVSGKKLELKRLGGGSDKPHSAPRRRKARKPRKK